MGKNSDILLSIGMIVKNEQRCIRRCLDALAPLRRAVPCELVIADTGSTDNTRETAAEYADILFDFEWCNDFSAARNAVMDRCSGKWFLTADADEYLDSDFSELLTFLTTSASDPYDAANIIQRNYNTFDMSGDNYNNCITMRMLRMSTGLRYCGTIHEMWELGKENRLITLLNTVFHHDGYVNDAKNSKVKKFERNLALLEKELEKEPDNFRRALQCLESSITYEQKRKYSLLTVELAEKQRDSIGRHWGGAGFSNAVYKANECNFPEFEEWAKKAREIYPDSLHVMLDVTFLNACYCMGTKKDFEQSLNELKLYRENIKKYNEMKNSRQEMPTVPLYFASDSKYQDSYSVEYYCQSKLGKWKQALKALEHIHLSGTDNMDRVTNLLGGIAALWKLTDEVDPSPLFIREYKAIEKDDDKTAKKRRHEFLKYCFGIFEDSKNEPPERPGWKLIASLGEGCDLGLAGLAAGTENKEEYERLMSQIKDMGNVPRMTLANAVKLDARLPGNFYGTKIEILENLAISLVQHEKEDLSKILLWDGLTAKADSAGQILWQFLVINAIVNTLDWEENGSLELYEKYCEKTRIYLDIFISKQICSEKNIHLTTPAVRFSWYTLQSFEAMNRNDQIGCLRFLRAALKENPSGDAMISYLTKQAEKLFSMPEKEASAELTALAEQVRAILSQFPPDDPAVLEIKKSEEYRLVAELIEKREG